VRAYSKDEVIEDHYGWRWDESTHKTLFRGSFACSAVSLGMAVLATI
jgi:hypothetical protein